MNKLELGTCGSVEVLVVDRIPSSSPTGRSPGISRQSVAGTWNPMAAALSCFECLQRRIESDLSADVLFRYGVSDSALPFGSSAIVQIHLAGEPDSVESEELSTHFILTRLTGYEESDCELQHTDLRTITNGTEKKILSSPEVGCSQSDVEILGDGMASLLENDMISSLTRGRGLLEVDDENPSTESRRRLSLLRMIATLSPVASVVRGSFSAVKSLVDEYISCSTEDVVMSSLSHLVEGSMAGNHASGFLSLVRFPALGDTEIHGCVRHPNIAPVLGALKFPDYSYLLQPKAPYTLENILHYSPKTLDSEWHRRFLIYQILSALHHIHSLGVAHGNVCPSNIMLTDSGWVWLNTGEMHLIRDSSSMKDSSCSSSNVYCCKEDCPCRAIYADLKLSMSINWHTEFQRWWKGELSNYEYLLVLNRLAGRRWGDHTFHPVMPWVIDFSVKPDEGSDIGWRDLKKSKWRLAKGDEQLDFTYSTSEIPHHVSDECLSELAVCSYKARRLPLRILRSAVRSVYEPNEYPSNMQRLYQWTPDECIPEFYSDPRIFVSLHSGMSDLAVPSWAVSPEEFISLHRNALESQRVSENIHHWIDITFGYKLSGQASIEAKNVMLPVADPSTPRSVGRWQLFTKPHPMRQSCRSHRRDASCSKISDVSGPPIFDRKGSVIPENSSLEDLEEAHLFCEHGNNLNPIYKYHKSFAQERLSLKLLKDEHLSVDISGVDSDASTLPTDLGSLIEYLEADDSGAMGFQEFFQWKHNSSATGLPSEDLAQDIFSIGCVVAEVYLKRPLFDPCSLSAYKESNVLPGFIQELPPHVAVLVEACIQRDWRRRASAKCLLQSQYFHPTVRSAHMFLSPLQLMAKSGHRLQYAAKLANKGALKVMGALAAEMCAPYCLALITSPFSDVETEPALCLLKEFLKCLSSEGIKALILPTIQKILQVSEYAHLKVSLLQDSFVRDLWKRLGKQTYLEKMHPWVISSLLNSSDKISTSAASVLLIGSCEELGIPVTVHQTILPLIHSFGKGLCADAVDALVRIGGLLGENFIVRHLFPLLRNAILSCIDIAHMNKPEPVQSWNSLALIDSLSTLNGLVSFLPVQVVVKELIQDQPFLPVKILMQSHVSLRVIQVAANALIIVCQRIGRDLTATHVLPHLKDLFGEIAFSQEAVSRRNSSAGNLKDSRPKLDEDTHIENRMDVVLLLYSSLAVLIGAEKLRQCCSTWFLLEQMLECLCNWKWESVGESSGGVSEVMNSQMSMVSGYHPSEYNPAKLLLNGVGWSIPQSQGVRSGTDIVNSKEGDELRHTRTSNFEDQEPWFWFPNPASSLGVPDFLGRNGALKDELPWKIKASVLHSARAHPGVLRSLAICHDECTLYSGGAGPGLKGSVQKWELSRMNCISGYYGHDEVVNVVCVLSTSGRVASCDGTIHVWNVRTGKLVVAYTETPTNFSHTAKMNTEQTNMLASNILSGGILSNAFNGNLYTCMDPIDFDGKLVAGMGNGSVRFIDIVRDQKLHLWKSDLADFSFSSLVSAICSSGSEKLRAERALPLPSWIATGHSSGHCRLFDARSGTIIANWRAHDGFITKLSAPEDHLLVSSSLDKTLRVWDLRRNLENQSNVFRGHLDGISGFSIWGQDVLSVSRNKIALTSLSKLFDEGGQPQLAPQTLYTADRGMKNLSVLSTISVLPFSRLFLVGTEDGYLKICC